MLPENVIYFGALLNVAASLGYIQDIVKGTTKPNLVSWIMWMLAPAIGVFLQLKAGAGLSVIPIFLGGLAPLVVILTALIVKNAIWKIHPFDLICGLFSLIALILYILTHNLAISILFAILSDALAFVPSFVKGWNHPETESSKSYYLWSLSNIVGLLIIKKWSFTIASFGVYFIIFNLAMALIISRKKIFPPKTTSVVS